MQNNEIIKLLEQTSKNLEKNNIKAFVAKTKEEVVPLIKNLINKGDTISNGGSESLKQCNAFELLKNGDYNYLDRNKEGLTPEQIREVYIKSFGADAYFCSCNAVTEDGVLYNVDGNSNRIAAIAFGPKSVIMVVGYNKIVKNIDEAIIRVKTIAAPLNCERLSCETYCKEKHQCVSLNIDNSQICDGCSSNSRVCCNYLISALQRHKDRIKVILVAEKLGY